MQPFFGPPFSSMPMQAPMQGMSHTANMTSFGGPIPQMARVGNQAMRGGGLLSRLLGGLGGASNSVSGPMTGGFSSAGAGGMNFTAMLTNAQRVLGLTQQVLPMVQQYGPLIRNAPALWRIMRSNNSDEDMNSVPEQEINTATTSIPIDDENQDMSLKEKSLIKRENHSTDTKTAPALFKPKTIEGIPAPKLYV